jgi:sugar phosphate isomerase/epimerase
MEPRDYKALLDKYGLKMYSTHSGATEGPGLEKQLEGQALMGIKYTGVNALRAARPPAGASGAGARPIPPAPTVESVQRSAEQMNKRGLIVKKFGMKILCHNHAGEFDLLAGGERTRYDVLLAETDPSLVAMQLDIGWAAVAGQDILEMFKKNPGRYELWHVKDAATKSLDPKATPSERQRAARIVPLGEGDIDYKTIFANARLAGMKYFVFEQDSAGRESGDAMADCRVSYRNLHKILS